jgi:hypothetical protein
MTAAFYCVADERYFLGAVAMINSLRLHGHSETVRLLDLGLAAWQRDLLAGEAEIVPGGEDAPPWLAKTVVPLDHPAETMVLIDADIVATRSLGELIDRAATDAVVAFENDTDRFVPEWGELLDLGPARRRRYVTSGLVLAGGETGRQAIELLADRERRVDLDRTFARADDPAYAFRYPEQDVLNAILAAAIPEERIVTLPNRLAANPPYAGLRIVDEVRLGCAYADGAEPFCLHQFVRKPWLEPMYHGIYSRLMARLLLAGDVAISVPPERVPRRMRTGARARVERAAVDAVDLGRWYLGERLPAWFKRIATGPGR